MQLLQFPEMGKQPIKKNNNRCMDSGQNDDHCPYIFTIKADAFIVAFACAKSSPLARQPDFMHMYHESAFIHSGEACRMGIYSELLTVSAAPNYPSHRSTRDCPASVSLVLVHAFIVRRKKFFQCLFSHIHGFVSLFKDTQERKMKLFIILDHTGRNGFSNSDL